MKTIMCGSVKCDRNTTLGDILQTIAVLEAYAGRWNTYEVVGHEYSQALTSLEVTLEVIRRNRNKLPPIARDEEEYVTKCSSDKDSFSVEAWKTIFKYNLWDAIVSYVHHPEITEDGFCSKRIATMLMDTRLRLDRALEFKRGERSLKHKLDWGYGASWSELFTWLWAKLKWRSSRHWKKAIRSIKELGQANG